MVNWFIILVAFGLLEIKGPNINSVNRRCSAAILVHLEGAICKGDVDEYLSRVPRDKFVNHENVIQGAIVELACSLDANVFV